MSRKFWWLLALLAIISGAIGYYRKTPENRFDSLPWPAGEYKEPNLIERTTP